MKGFWLYMVILACLLTGACTPLSSTPLLIPATATFTQAAPTTAAPPTLTISPKRSIQLTLACEAPQQILSASEIKGYPVTFTHSGDGPVEIQISLETLSGEPWAAAVCYEELCFMHDGLAKMIESMSALPEMQYEIKVFVSEEARSSETKTLRFSVAVLADLSQSASVDIIGTVP